jgi:D-3-phosphoglycerate dehydrogenase / 2-oxoglutarate reductase
MSAPRLLVTCGHLQRHIERYRAEVEGHGIELLVPPLAGQQFDAAAMAKHLPQAEIVIAGDDDLDETALVAGAQGRLRSVIRWGIGTDNVDKLVAQRLNLPVYNTPGVFSDEVADLALGHVLNLARHLHKMDRDVRAGNWTRYEGVSLSGKIAGVVGLGGIGRAVARRCSAFGMTVVGHDALRIDPALLSMVNTTQLPFAEILRDADIVLICCNLVPETRHLINTAALAAMKRGVMLVNVARGPVIDETALVQALRSGHVGSAGLDVFEVEPLPADSPLRGFDNCLFGTHAGSGTAEAIQRVNRSTVDIALALLGIGAERLIEFHRVA